MFNHLHHNIQRILVIQLRAIGDVVLTTPVLSVLKKHIPGATIDFLTTRGVGNILKGLPELQNVLELAPNAGFREIRAMLQKIRAQHYDLVIDYQGTNTPAILTYFSGSTYRLGWQRVRRRWAYNLKGQPVSEDVYVPIKKCQLLRTIGIEETDWHPRVSYSDEARQRASAYLQRYRGTQGPVINVSIAGKRQARQWFPDRWAQTIDLLQEHLNATVFINTTAKELPYVENVTALCRKPPYILPRWNLETFVAYLSMVDLHLSYDNGVKHLAVALDVPTVSFYGSARPDQWHPPAQTLHRAIYPDVICRGCGRIWCGAMICMATIRPSDVVTLVEQQLSRKNNE